MARPSAKHTSARLLLLICVDLLGIAIADVLWASSPRFIHSYNDIADNWAPPVDISKPTIIAFPKKTSHETPHQGQYGPQCRGPRAHTFVLDSETRQWQNMPPLPVPRYAPATQLWRGRLHVMGGSGENWYTP